VATAATAAATATAADEAEDDDGEFEEEGKSSDGEPASTYIFEAELKAREEQLGKHCMVVRTLDGDLHCIDVATLVMFWSSSATGGMYGDCSVGSSITCHVATAAEAEGEAGTEQYGAGHELHYNGM
jgi:hypothetical protein